MSKKLGVLLVDVPEPRYWNYTFVVRTSGGFFDTWDGGTVDMVVKHAYLCTQEDAKKFPQFRWGSVGGFVLKLKKTKGVEYDLQN